MIDRAGGVTPQQFVEKWSRVELSERSASQQHFIDLCRLLRQPTPADHDATGAEYAFEKGVGVSSGASQGAKGEYGFAGGWQSGCDRFMDRVAEFSELSREVQRAEMPELLHPRMSDVYREKVGSLCLALESEESRTGAADAIRALVEAILLEPDGDQLKITLKGDLAGMLSAARDSKRSPDTGDLMVQIKLVAGAGFEPATFGL